MDAFETIITRRSIRKYTHDEISKETIDKLLKAAMYAPSAVNKQPWHFIIIDNKSIFEKIMEVHPHAKMLNEAALAIIICGDTKLAHGDGIYWPVDCAAATENMLLAAHGLGLGAVWLGVYPREERISGIEKLFKLPANIKPFSIISLGYPAETKEQPDRFIKERIHYNKW
ncbi:MAG: nitroreductase family protein [Bacteroidales bacterium]|nr:nitroreductase family protein [Bacteroidales bacterium]